MDPQRRQLIDEAHELLKGTLYPENHVLRRKIDEAFLLSERPSKSQIDYTKQMLFKSDRSLPFSILAIYDSQFSIQEELEVWLAEEVLLMAKHLLDYPKLAYVNYPYEGPYRDAIAVFNAILQVDEYRSFWLDFNAGMKGSADSNLTQMKLQLKQEVKQELKAQLKQEVKAELKGQLKQEVKVELKNLLKQEVKAELKDQLKQEVKAELKHQLEQEVKQALMQSCGDKVRNMVNNATDKLLATFEGTKRQLRDDLRSSMMAEIRREFDRSSESQ